MTPRRSARFVLVLTMGLLALAPHAGRPAPVTAATLTFTVNSTADAPDVNPGDGICADAAGQCTLRAAIQEADAQPSGSHIAINVPAGTYGLTLGTLHLSANAIAISGALSSTTIISGNNTSTIMAISPTVQARLSQITITGGNAGTGNGGGLVNAGQTFLSQSIVLSNTATKGGGIVNSSGGRLWLDGSTLSGNTATYYSGSGGIFNTGTGTATVTGSTFSGNAAGTGGYGAGGAIFSSGALTVTGSTFSGNAAGSFGGGLYNSGEAAVTNSSFISNTATGGGGLYNSGALTVAIAAFSGNTAQDIGGGGLYNFGTLSVISSTVSGNTADDGGGIGNRGTLSLSASTLSDNVAYDGAGLSNSVSSEGGTVEVTNSTFSGDSAYGGGGGIYNGNPGIVSVTNSTLNGNGAKRGGGDIYAAGSVTLTGNIVAYGASGPNCTGSPTDNGYNLDSGTTCGFSLSTDFTNTNPLLGPLANNGGPTQTMDPLAGSPAIDHGGTSATGCPAADQRGRPRPDEAADNGACDIGAVEVHYPSGPSVYSVVPNRGPYTGGTVVVIHGANLLGPDQRTTVRFGGLRASSVITDVSGQVITATSPATSGPSIVDVSVQTSAGTSPHSLLDQFTYTWNGALYVATSGSDQNSCLTPHSACRTVGHALAVAASGATINAAAGIYTGTVQIPLSLTLRGAGAASTILDGNAGGTVVTVHAPARVALSGLTIRNGAAIGYAGGGGIRNEGTLSVKNSTLISNMAYQGGAIANGGTLTITGSTLISNTAGQGGGLFNAGTLSVSSSTLISNTSPNGGGGVFNSGTMSVTTSILNGNSAPIGGGLWNIGTLSMSNSTLSGNSAGDGGGLYNDYGGKDTLNYDTIASNSSGIDTYSGVVALGGTIVANSTTGANCTGSITDRGYNLDSGTTCGLSRSTDITNTNPLLGPLANNGGPTQTMALLPGSPAIDEGGTHATGCPATDQRGMPRPDEAADHGACDIGAYESQRVG